MSSQAERNRITIAILALGGQGGGVLAEWIQSLARAQGWLAQGTSVPGVAQRTGSTVYYVELAQKRGGKAPLMAQMPVPNDVDIVIASELMETGRALLRGFADAARTTLIGSTHRIYAISEKSAMGDGRGDSQRVIAAARAGAKRAILFDMQAATDRSGSVISSVMFGALAASEALPFPAASFEQAITASGVAVESNLKGFAAGFAAAQRGDGEEPMSSAPPRPTTARGAELAACIAQELPAAARDNALLGLQRLVDYQDFDYAALYLDRLRAIAALETGDGTLTAEVARYLALWMSYDDIIRVADLKTRASRMERVAGEVRPGAANLLTVTEFMHPRLREICDILPVGLAHFLLRQEKMLAFLFRRGRQVETTRLRWFLLLRGLASLRRFRKASLRYHEEQQRIEAWLAEIRHVAPADPSLAIELAQCQRLIKGYGDTFDRGWRSFALIMEARAALPPDSDAALIVRRLREAALADERGDALSTMLNGLSP